MGLDTTEIRHEIRQILRSEGRTRSKKIADQVMKKVGSEKTVYREIKNLCNLGEIRKIEHSRADIEYELVELADAIDKQLAIVFKNLDEIKESLNKLHEKMEKTKLPYIERLSKIVLSIKQLQKLEARMKILSMFPLFKKSKSFNYIEKQIERTWDLILGLTAHQHDEKFLYELMYNFHHMHVIEAKPIEKSKE